MFNVLSIALVYKKRKRPRTGRGPTQKRRVCLHPSSPLGMLTIDRHDDITVVSPISNNDEPELGLLVDPVLTVSAMSSRLPCALPRRQHHTLGVGNTRTNKTEWVTDSSIEVFPQPVERMLSHYCPTSIRKIRNSHISHRHPHTS